MGIEVASQDQRRASGTCDGKIGREVARPCSVPAEAAQKSTDPFTVWGFISLFSLLKRAGGVGRLAKRRGDQGLAHHHVAPCSLVKSRARSSAENRSMPLESLLE
ncbi:MAG: hypothetical protein D6723_11220 [Acidobacteria bacterium]|nr:MAG: hypothetical protein D6723_11220 [Acidobacteriota bacterium]